MYFSSLKYDVLGQINGEVDIVENKQRLNLSDRAYSVLHQDMDVLPQGKDSKKGTIEIPSGIVNTVFRNFREEAESSVAIALYQSQMQLDELVKRRNLASSSQELCSVLLEARLEELQQKKQKRIYEKGHAFTIRLDKENTEYLVSDEGQEESKYYNDNIGLYLKAVIEEFAELPYIKREQIYAKKLVDIFHQAAREHKMLHITLHSVNKAEGTHQNNILYMKPAFIKQDAENLYNYLVGMISRHRDGPWNVGAIRLSSVKDMKQLAYTGLLHKADENNIESAIRAKGVQFISAVGETEKIVVQFTPQGEKMYHSILHLRPAFIKKRESRIYEFDCTRRQAKNYFFKFGKDVKIIEPQNLKEQFVCQYKLAQEQYKK